MTRVSRKRLFTPLRAGAVDRYPAWGSLAPEGGWRGVGWRGVQGTASGIRGCKEARRVGTNEIQAETKSSISTTTVVSPSRSLQLQQKRHIQPPPGSSSLYKGTTCLSVPLCRNIGRSISCLSPLDSATIFIPFLKSPEKRRKRISHVTIMKQTPRPVPLHQQRSNSEAGARSRNRYALPSPALPRPPFPACKNKDLHHPLSCGNETLSSRLDRIVPIQIASNAMTCRSTREISCKTAAKSIEG